MEAWKNNDKYQEYYKTLLENNIPEKIIDKTFLELSHKNYFYTLDLKQQLSQLQQENEQLKADYGNKAQVERDILIQENIDLKQKMIRILENIDVSYNDWKKWKDELKESDK